MLFSYTGSMTRVFLANRQPEARAAFRILLMALDMQVVGEAANWSTTLTDAPATRPDIILVDGELLTFVDREMLSTLRSACETAVVIVLLSHLEASEQAALSAGADIFISKGETPDRVADHLCSAARNRGG